MSPASGLLGRSDPWSEGDKRRSDELDEEPEELEEREDEEAARLSVVNLNEAASASAIQGWVSSTWCSALIRGRAVGTHVS